MNKIFMPMNLRITLLLSVLAISQALFGQEYDTYRGHQVFAHTVIVKLDLRSQLKSAPMRPEVPGLNKLLKAAGATPLKQMFPHSVFPQCDNCVDISTIYQFSYTADIPVEQVVDAIAALPQVVYAQPEFVQELFYVPNDPRMIQQYHHTTIHTIDAWDTFRSDTTIVIGITDTGCDIGHEDLSGSIAYNYDDPINGIDDDNDGYIDNFRGWDFGGNDNNPSIEASDHGTWVSGLAAATANNKLGIAGSSFGAKFLPIKIADNSGSLRDTWVSVVYAADHGCQIINCSWGNKFKEPVGEDVVNYATFNRNALVVAAAGNNSTQEEYYPASFRNVLSVAGTVENDQKWAKSNSQSASGSSWGYYVDVTAPAASYYSTANNNSYTFMYGGTSFASPITAGVAALVKTAFPKLSAIALAEQIKAQSDKIDTIAFNLPYQDMLGTGRINAKNATSRFDRPGIRYSQYSLSNKEVIRPGDTVLLTVDIANYLAPADSVTVAVEFNSRFITLIQSQNVIRNFAGNDTVTGITFSFSFSDALPLDFETNAKLIYTSGSYRAYEYINISTNTSSKQLVTNMLRVNLPSNGRIGYARMDTDENESFSALSCDNLLNDAGLFFVEASNKGASSCLGRQDFIITEPTAPSKNDSAQYCFISRYRADLLELDVAQTVRGWDDSTYFTIDYSIINTSVLEKHTLIAGNYWDWNVRNGLFNYTGFHAPTGLSYTYSTEPQTIYTGTMLLGADTTNVFASDYNVAHEGLPDIYNDITDPIRYACATTWHPEIKYTSLGSNTSVFQSAAPRYLDRGDTMSYRVAVLFAADYDKLTAQADRLKKASALPTAQTCNVPLDMLRIYPTVTSGDVSVTGWTNGEIMKISVITGEGTQVAVPHQYNGNTIILSLGQLPHGLYFISLQQLTNTRTVAVLRQ